MHSERDRSSRAGGRTAGPKYYTADSENTLVRWARPYDAAEILEEVFHQDFAGLIQEAMDRDPRAAAIAAGRPEAREFRLIRPNKPRVRSAFCQPERCTRVDLIFRPTVEATVPAGREAGIAGVKRDRFLPEYRISYLLDLKEKICSRPTAAAAWQVLRDEFTEMGVGVSDAYLLPVLGQEDYPAIAKDFLRRYYPEALEEAAAVDGRRLAARMGLKVRRVRLESGSEAMGLVTFDRMRVKLQDAEGRVKEESIPPMTVLINTALCRTEEAENTTLVHECCHVYLDRLFFRLQMLSGKPCTVSMCRRRPDARPAVRTGGPLTWMETQAEKLPAYILMEENNSLSLIEQLMAEDGGARTPENIGRVIRRLAEDFGVSRSMARCRMIELGYPEAEGVFGYLDSRRIPDHGCGGAWPCGVSYSISPADAGALLRESAEFRRALGSRRYVYAEGHFCLDEPRYIQAGSGPEKSLTAYARHHMEECCIAFEVGGYPTGTAGEAAWAARKRPVKDQYQTRYSFAAEPETKAGRKENELFTADARLWAALEAELPDDIAGAVQVILDRKGLPQEELAMRLGVSRAALRKWCTRGMSLRHVVAICIALDVWGHTGENLVRLAGYSFRRTEEQEILQMMLYHTEDLTVARANEIMRQHGLKPLTEGKEEEF
ncbi:MAG: hypothetical protein IJI13_11045 [Oscillospiraceae bacterium]|nr:hypothetical protein [Oscillospiraceae bacterium]